MFFGCMWLGMVMQTPPLHAQSGATGQPLSIAIFVSSRKDQCFDSGEVAAIRQLSIAERDRINASGGIARRQIELQFLDDNQQEEQTLENVKKALANPHTVAMVGLTSATRAKATFTVLGSAIGSSGIPFLSDIALNSVFQNQANVYTMRPSQDDDRVPVIVEFIKSRGIQRVAFVGQKNALISSSLGDGLAKVLGTTLIADHRLTAKENKLDAAEVAATIEDLKQKNADLVVLLVGGIRTASMLAALTDAGLTPSIFVTARLETILEGGTPEYPGDIFQLAWDDLPDVFSDRVRQRVVRNGLDRWLFEGAKVPQAPGWAKGECKPRSEDAANVFNTRNIRAIARGTQFADMVALVADALKGADPKADVAGLRSYMLERLKTTYAAGRGAFRGSFENWSFRSASRAADRTPFIVMRPNGLGASQLAPVQFVRLRNDKYRWVNTLYVDIDLIRTFRVDDNDKSFFADFYISMRGKNASIEQIEFANAFLDPKTNGRQLNIRTLHDGSPSEVFPAEMKIYLVSGKFMYEPRLANYPFDTQRFAVDIQPRSSDAPFIVQPPPHSLRDRAVITDGWNPKEDFVGYDEDFVPTIDAWTHRQSIVPFYKASFVWLMQRQTTDYYLRVVVPLAFILAVAYLSIFIPSVHFEAIVTIQVTALLSSVALYLALPKLDADSTTLSDKIFLFAYMAVSLMIGISILRVVRVVAHAPRLKKVVAFVHMILLPALVAAMALYIYRASLSEG